MPVSDILYMIVPLLLAGGIAGFLAGLLGIGGGLVIVPVLFETLRLKGVDSDICMHIAVGTSLALIVATGLSSARAHIKRGSVDRRVFRAWALPMIVGVIAGGIIADHSKGPVLSVIFGCVALLAALKLMLPDTANNTHTIRTINTPWRQAIPATIGCISAMMGIGGGAMTVPTLSALGYITTTAVGTSAAMGLLVAIPGAIVYAINGLDAPNLPWGNIGYVNVPAFLSILPISTMAAPLGAKVAHTINGTVLKRGFALFLIITATRMLWSAATPG